MTIQLLILAVAVLLGAMVLCWYFGATIVLSLTRHLYEGFYAAGEEFSIAYGIGAFAHTIVLSFLKKRLGADDVRLAPVMVQTAVLLSAQEKYKPAESFMVSAKELYEAALTRSQQKDDKVALQYNAQELAQLGLDYASLLEVTGRKKDAPQMLLRVARNLEDKGFANLAASLSGEAAKYEK
ncbi:MAG: hypothetical protein C0507_16760 [Cyanobacteria bacterium PR.3.49]|jgi:hypothetical protein|nr:hypothetical protein [Cyanobacteria bacterium PR.3.49]